MKSRRGTFSSRPFARLTENGWNGVAAINRRNVSAFIPPQHIRRIHDLARSSLVPKSSPKDFFNHEIHEIHEIVRGKGLDVSRILRISWLTRFSILARILRFLIPCGFHSVFGCLGEDLGRCTFAARFTAKRAPFWPRAPFFSMSAGVWASERKPASNCDGAT